MSDHYVIIRLSKDREEEMSSNYPEGSMRGSGIYAEDYSGIFYCDNCEDEFVLDGQTDDWGHNASAECPDCGAILNKEIADEGGYDEDAAYDQWRDERD
jgi:hypothetical protein